MKRDADISYDVETLQELRKLKILRFWKTCQMIIKTQYKKRSKTVYTSPFLVGRKANYQSRVRPTDRQTQWHLESLHHGLKKWELMHAAASDTRGRFPPITGGRVVIYDLYFITKSEHFTIYSLHENRPTDKQISLVAQLRMKTREKAKREKKAKKVD